MSKNSSNTLFAQDQKALCLLVIQLYGNRFSQRDRVIFEMVLMGDSSISTIASQFNLSGARVSQICQKTFRLLKSYIATSVKNTASSQVAEAESRKLKEENEEFKINAALSKNNKTVSNKGFKAPLTEIGLSVRLINSLANHSVYTIEDLKQLSIIDILKMRHVGRKSITELENVLHKYSITLN